MKYTIDISDKDIETAVFNVLVRQIAESIFTERYTLDRCKYADAMRKALTAVLKERSDEIVERCIPRAAEYIGKKGVKKFVDELGKKVESDA